MNHTLLSTDDAKKGIRECRFLAKLKMIFSFQDQPCHVVRVHRQPRVGDGKHIALVPVVSKDSHIRVEVGLRKARTSAANRQHEPDQHLFHLSSPYCVMNKNPGAPYTVL